MCLLVFAIDGHPRFRLVLAANRDEYADRPTLASAFWAEHPGLLAGRDRRGGGTWLGVTRSGRVAAVTNVRNSPPAAPGAPSRGALPVAFLAGCSSPAAFAAERAADGHRYAGYNLLVGDRHDWFWTSNRAAAPVRLGSGIHAVSNDALDTPWPKVEDARRRLADLLAALPPAADGDAVDGLFHGLLEILTDSRCNHDPSACGPTGPRSAIFVDDGRYRTRTSTLLTLDNDGEARWQEITWPARTLVEHRFRWCAADSGGP